MNSSIAIQILPIVEDKNEVIRIVDEVIAYIDGTGVNYQVGAFETTLEGDYDQLMDILKNIPLVGTKAGADSVMTYVKINYQAAGDVLTIAKKTDKYR
ncbi:thiamine-binding protein [Periweissella cryptocerci]|uniref:Thiamine-binding protein n=1 Tax=Periweissella cryptocerci TaxID=2506420 RepID=A0A4P6YW93_9LACO|nr:thiamine-binding protein [Periweissella cryptocerci]QBO37122.1 thiamine-binding protein [Periweissella cryptocerci]